MSGISAVCGACGRIIESTHRHDLQMCPCGKSGLDGGNIDYNRVIGEVDVNTIHTWDWTAQDGRRLKAEHITDDHYRNIIRDGYVLSGRLKKEARKRGLLDE